MIEFKLNIEVNKFIEHPLSLWKIVRNTNIITISNGQHSLVLNLFNVHKISVKHAFYGAIIL